MPQITSPQSELVSDGSMRECRDEMSASFENTQHTPLTSFLPSSSTEVNSHVKKLYKENIFKHNAVKRLFDKDNTLKLG